MGLPAMGVHVAWNRYSETGVEPSPHVSTTGENETPGNVSSSPKRAVPLGLVRVATLLEFEGGWSRRGVEEEKRELEVQARYWQLVQSGMGTVEACRLVGCGSPGWKLSSTAVTTRPLG